MVKVPVLSEQRTSTPKTSKFNLITILQYAFLGFISVALPLIYYKPALDITMMPRVTALSAFLFLFSLLFIGFAKSKELNFSVLRYKLFWVLAAWLIVSVVSMFFAKNPVEGIYDIIKVFFVLATALFGTMIFIRKENWIEIIVKLIVISSIIAGIIGVVQYFMWVYGNENAQLTDGRSVIASD